MGLLLAFSSLCHSTLFTAILSPLPHLLLHPPINRSRRKVEHSSLRKAALTFLESSTIPQSLTVCCLCSSSPQHYILFLALASLSLFLSDHGSKLKSASSLPATTTISSAMTIMSGAMTTTSSKHAMTE